MKKAWRIFKKWFIPHDENDHKPHILRPRTIALVCVLSIAAELLFLSGLSVSGFFPARRFWATSWWEH